MCIFVKLDRQMRKWIRYLFCMSKNTCTYLFALRFFCFLSFYWENIEVWFPSKWKSTKYLNLCNCMVCVHICKYIANIKETWNQFNFLWSFYGHPHKLYLSTIDLTMSWPILLPASNLSIHVYLDIDKIPTL